MSSSTLSPQYVQRSSHPPTSPSSAADGPARRPSREELIYLAGFLDGEGCIGHARDPHLRRKRKFYNRVVVCNQCDPRPLRRLAAAFGGEVFVRDKAVGNHRTAWSWYICGDLAAAACRLLLPFLQLKRREARLLLMANRSNGQRISALVRRLRHREKGKVKCV